MKKYLLIALSFIASISLANAQYQPEGSKLSTEINYTPGAEEGISMPSYGLRLRYDLNDKWSTRLSLGYEYESGLAKSYEDSSLDASFGSVESNSSIFSIVPGIEYHFKNHGRVFPYVGAQLGYYGGRAIKLTESSNNRDYQKEIQPVNAFVIGAFTGVDVFLCEALYIGAELGFDYEYMHVGRTKIRDGELNEPGFSSSEGLTSGKESHLGFNVVPSVRIGWYF